MRIVSGQAGDGWQHITEAGSYEWWYFDAISDDERTAVVLIWFAGLPFSPDYLTDYERGRGPDPLDHVALFAALYRDGKQICYALNRYDRSAFGADEAVVGARIGPNTFATTGGPSGPCFELKLDVPILYGGERLSGNLRFEPNPALRQLDLGRGDRASAHVWNPVAPDCRVTGTLDLRGAGGKEVLGEHFGGRGYHDHNYGTTPLTEGIRRWHWGRVHLGETTVVYYHLEPTAGVPTSLLAVAGGAPPSLVAERAQFRSADWRRRPLCPRFATTVDVTGGDGGARVHLNGRIRNIVDWGPFYMRFLTDFALRTSDGNTARGVGISEYLDPRGLRNRLLRPLIKTRIRRVV